MVLPILWCSGNENLDVVVDIWLFQTIGLWAKRLISNRSKAEQREEGTPAMQPVRAHHTLRSARLYKSRSRAKAAEAARVAGEAGDKVCTNICENLFLNEKDKKLTDGQTENKMQLDTTLLD